MFLSREKPLRAPTGNQLHDASKAWTEMLSGYIATLGLQNPRTYGPTYERLPDVTLPVAANAGASGSTALAAQNTGLVNAGGASGAGSLALLPPMNAQVANYALAIPNVGSSATYPVGVGGGGGQTIFRPTPKLKTHIKYRDTSVPRKRGIGGVHNSKEFFKNDVEIVSETFSKIPGVKTVEYKMPKLNADGTPTGEYGARVFKKTIYDPDVISDDEYIKRGIEAANDALSKSNDGVLSREWFGVDSEGTTWHGYFENGEITSFFPDE